MSRVAELIDLIAQGKNAEASEVLNFELLARSYKSIENIKPEIAQGYFAPFVGEFETEQSEQEDTDETN